MNAIEARRLAERLHAGQVDKAGQPYIGHLLRVEQALPAHLRGGPLSEAAMLHDAVEDGKATMAILEAAGVSPRALELIDRLSRRAGEAYSDYLERVSTDPDAVVVKRCDLADNMAPARLAALSAEQADKLRAKYTAALELLDGA